MFTKQKTLFVLLALMLSPFGFAQTYSPPVNIHFITDGRGYAEGSLGGTRNSNNNIEYITCIVDREINGSQQNTFVNCMARDASARTISCTSTDDAIARGLGGATTDAIIHFGFDEEGSCTGTHVYKSSSLTPKN